MWTAIFTGIGHGCEKIFKFVPGIGPYVNLMFFSLACIGTAYWIYYEIKVSKGGDNYLSKK